MSKRRRTAYIYNIIAALIFGVSGPIIKKTVGYIDPLPLLAYRFAISGLIALAYFGIRKPHLPRKFKNKIGLILYGIFAVTLAIGLLFLAFDQTSSLSTTMITSNGPLFIVLAGALVLHERITKQEKIGITIALMGSIIIVATPLLNGPGTRASLTGNILALAHMFAGATGVIIGKITLRGRVSPTTLAHASFLIGMFTLIPAAFYFSGAFETIRQIVTAPLPVHASAWFLAIVTGIVGHIARNRGIKSIEVSEATLFAYLTPLFAAPLAIYWLGDKLTFPFIIGGIVIGTGVYIAEHKIHKTRRKRG